MFILCVSLRIDHTQVNRVTAQPFPTNAATTNGEVAADDTGGEPNIFHNVKNAPQGTTDKLQAALPIVSILWSAVMFGLLLNLLLLIMYACPRLARAGLRRKGGFAREQSQESVEAASAEGLSSKVLASPQSLFTVFHDMWDRAVMSLRDLGRTTLADTHILF